MTPDKWTVVAIVLMLAVLIVIGALIFKGNSPPQTWFGTASDGTMVRGGRGGASVWCKVSVVELEGHKYIVAVSPHGCAVCPASKTDHLQLPNTLIK